MGLKPMNCPAHCSSTRTRQALLPRPADPLLRAGPRAPPRAERTLHGLLRVRHFTQDDAHIFCTEEQIEDEVVRCLEFGFAIYDRFGFERGWSSRPGRRSGSAPRRCGTAPRRRCERRWRHRGLAYELNEGDGAFYGPKIDLHMTDAIGRSWQLGHRPARLQDARALRAHLHGADNAEHRPVMIHRALMGSFERFIGILIEHYAGEFPVWLAPVQAIVLPVADRHVDYAREVQAELVGLPRRGRRPHRVDRAQDPRGRAAQGPVHARGRRPRGRAADGLGAPPPRGRSGRARSRPCARRSKRENRRAAWASVPSGWSRARSRPCAG